LRILYAKDAAFMDKQKPVNNTASCTIDGVSGHKGKMQLERHSLALKFYALSLLTKQNQEEWTLQL